MAVDSQTKNAAGPIDDSRHAHFAPSPKLEDLAATAALYVTNQHRSKDGNQFLDGDNKLSSAGKDSQSETAELIIADIKW